MASYLKGLYVSTTCSRKYNTTICRTGFISAFLTLRPSNLTPPTPTDETSVNKHIFELKHFQYLRALRADCNPKTNILVDSELKYSSIAVESYMTYLFRRFLRHSVLRRIWWAYRLVQLRCGNTNNTSTHPTDWNVSSKLCYGVQRLMFYLFLQQQMLD